MKRPTGITVPGNRWDLLDGQTPAEPPRVSVVVVHFRQPQQLARTLDALTRQTHPADRLEVIVVDDGSPTPPTVPPGVRLLVQEDRGFRAAAARNLGARHASGDVLCFLDADTTPEPAYVEQLSRLPALAPEAVTVARRRHAELTDASGPIEQLGPAHELPAPAWLADGYDQSADLLDADARSYRYVLSSVLACTRWFFAEVGGFDASFDAYGGEDWEFAHRAFSAGALLAHVPEAVAWHDGPDWAGRPDARAGKNAEAVRLAAAIPVAGSRGHGVRGAEPPFLVRLHAAPSAAAAFLCVDELLTALPEAHVVVPPEHLAPFVHDPRVSGAGPASSGAGTILELDGPVRVNPAALRAEVLRFEAGEPGVLELAASVGRPLLRLTAARAEARHARWQRTDLFPSRQRRVDWLLPVDGEPDLEAHLGGWEAWELPGSPHS